MTKLHETTIEQQMRLQELRAMPPDEYEKICKKCGLCCLCKIGIHDITLYTNLCCNYLDPKTKRCTIYKDRLVIQRNDCAKVTPDLVVTTGLVPRTCGYVEYIYGPANKPIKIDWTKVKPCGNVDLSALLTGLDCLIWDSLNWRHR